MAIEQRLHILSLGPSPYDQYGQISSMTLESNLKDTRIKHFSSLDTAAVYLCVARDRVDGVIIQRPNAQRLLIAQARLKKLAGDTPIFLVDIADLKHQQKRELIEGGIHIINVPIGMVEVKEMMDTMFANRPKPEVGRRILSSSL